MQRAIWCRCVSAWFLSESFAFSRRLLASLSVPYTLFWSRLVGSAGIGGWAIWVLLSHAWRVFFPGICQFVADDDAYAGSKTTWCCLSQPYLRHTRICPTQWTVLYLRLSILHITFKLSSNIKIWEQAKTLARLMGFDSTSEDPFDVRFASVWATEKSVSHYQLNVSSSSMLLILYTEWDLK
jgi:hypothetical protein